MKQLVKTSKSPLKKNSLFFAALLVVLLGVSFFFYHKNSWDGATPIGELKTTGNETLENNISRYMESQKTGNELGADNYHCKNYLYGYDDIYAYAWVYCSGFVMKGNDWEEGTGFGAPTRLEYTRPDFRIINAKQPGDGSAYTPTLKQLFPEEIYKKIKNNPSAEVTQKLVQEVKDKARAK